MPDKTFDACTIAFGIRNVTHIEKALWKPFASCGWQKASCARVLHVEALIPLMCSYDFHSFQVIPRLGKLAAGDADSYRYLVESIRRFPTQKRFAKMIEAAGQSVTPAQPCAVPLLFTSAGESVSLAAWPACGPRWPRSGSRRCWSRRLRASRL